MPRGHALIESYLFAPTSKNGSQPQSLTYLLYGVSDQFTLGIIPDAGFNVVKNGPDGAGPHWGDTGILAKYALTKADPENFIPDVSLALQENVPTGKYDRLGANPGNAFGAGAYATILSLYTQSYFWLPNGRLLRARLDLSESVAPAVPVRGVSVYGTDQNFMGDAGPGNSVSADLSLEYSITRSWVLATDIIVTHANNTRVSGADAGHNVFFNSGSSDLIGFAPAVEFSWTPNLGVLLGARIIPAGHNVTGSIAPAVAINWFY